MGDAYDNLTQEVKNGTIRIYFIISPPRCSSTALERALSRSEGIQIQINDPWAIYDEERESKTYAYIWDKLKQHVGKNVVHVLIKNVADYIPPGEAMERFLNLVEHTIVLIRNPILSLESLLRVEAKSLNDDVYARKYGYSNWSEMIEKTSMTRNYTEFEEIYKEHFLFGQKIHKDLEMWLPVLNRLTDAEVKRLGYSNRDEYSEVKGFKDWSDLISKSRESDTLNSLRDLWDEVFQCRVCGWEALYEHFQDIRKRADRFTIVDSTIFRQLPDKMLALICKRMGISYSSQMVEWSDSKQFETDYDGSVPYYDEVLHSNKVKPATESIIEVDRFPEFIRDYLLKDNGAFEIYARLFFLMKSHLRNSKILECVPESSTDPVFVYCLREERRTQLRSDFMRFDTVFDKIDKTING